MAPSRLEAAIFFMVSLPYEKLMTFVFWYQANSRAQAAPTKPIQK